MTVDETTTTANDDAPVVLGSLSPSRAADFKTCPLLYRFRTIDRLPEAASRAATRGTVVHSVLERVYDLPAAQRTVEAARELVGPAWQQLLIDDPRVGELFAADENGTELAEWLASAGDLVDNYFALEDPTRLEPASREELVEIVIDGLRLTGLRRSHRRLAGRRHPGRRLQDRFVATGGVRGEGAVPDEVLRPRALAAPRRRPAPAAADVPRRP